MENTNNWYQPPDSPPVPDKKKIFRKQINFISGSLLIYTVILFAVAIVYMIAVEIIGVVIEEIKPEIFDYDAFMEQFQETDMGMGLAVIIGCLFMLLFYFKRIKPKQIFIKRQKKMTISKLLMLICVLMCIQFPISLFDVFFEALLNQLGFSAQAAIESSQAGSTTISMMLYAGFIGPFAEEFVYRGYTMQSLERTGAGKGYALLISSILFGIMHANPTQSVYAVFAGLVFGYTAMEYGIIWSMILHMLNNFLFGDVLVFLTRNLPENISNLIGILIMLFLFLAGILILIVKRKSLSAYIRENFATDAECYKLTFTSILFLLFISVNIFMAVMQIQAV
ncbi:MAG: CPBP family intramembrane metalloprotease [Ruminococcus sp.]|nr:CPBP family intramembrane metalloprotease [Ruminococcus sp.]